MAEVKRKVAAQSDRPEAKTKSDKDFLKKAQKQPEDNLVDVEKKLFAGIETGTDAPISDEQYVYKARQKFQVAADARRRYDWEWLARDLFRRGYQFTKYNPQTKTVILSQVTSTKIPVNLTAAAIRSIRNQAVVFKPKWEVVPNAQDEETQNSARYSGKTLDYVFDICRLRKKIKEVVTQGLIYSVGGAWQIIWNPELLNADGSKGFVEIWGSDPFDFYVDPAATDGMAFTDAEYVIKAIRKPLDEVKTNPQYKNTGLLTTGEMRPAASEYKQFLLQSIKFQGGTRNVDETKTVILKEGWFKERDKGTGKVKMRVITWVDLMTLPLRNELIDTSDFPFRMYQADINPNEVYGEGWARHVIPINRVINALESSIFDYNYKFNKGRIVIDKNSGVSVVDNQHGSIIQKNRGATVTSLPIQPMASSAENQVMRMGRYFEDIAGAHDASLGRVPTGVKSGIGIAELKQADATNQDDLVDNLEDFLIEVGKKILKLISENMTFPQLVSATKIAGKTDYFAIIGENAGKTRKKKTVTIGKEEYPLAVIRSDNTLRVQIGSWLAYSKQQQQQELKDLFQSGVIDQRTLLEHMEFGDIDTIVTRTRQEALLKARQEATKVGQTEVSEEELAMTENSMLLMGDERVMPLPSDDHKVHMAVHANYSGNKLVDLHTQQHQLLLESAQKGQGVQNAGMETPAGQPTGPAGTGEVPMEGIPPEAQQPLPPEVLQALQQGMEQSGQIASTTEVPMA
jgi:hypothetical protein